MSVTTVTRPGSKHLLLTGSRSWWYLCIHNTDIYNQQCRLLRFAIPERLTHSHWIWPLVKHSAVIPELFWCSWWPLYSQHQFTSTYTSTISFNLRVSVRVTRDVLLEELCIFQLLDSANDGGYNTQHSRPWHDIYNAVDTEDIVNIYTHMFTHQSNMNRIYIQGESKKSGISKSMYIALRL